MQINPGKWFERATWAEAAIVVLSIGLIIVGVLNYIALVQANAIADDTAKKQLRAYVLPVDAEVEDSRVTFRFKNFGLTPADDGMLKGKTWWAEPGDNNEQSAKAIEPKEVKSLGTGEETAATIKAAKENVSEGVLHASVELEYADIFGTSQKTPPFIFVQETKHGPNSKHMRRIRRGR